MYSLEQFLRHGREAVALAEKVTMMYFGKSAEELGVLTKQDDTRFSQDHQKSPVTLADTQAEHVIKSYLRQQFPEHGFIGEEEGVEKSSADYKWIIDPIDGTRDFSRGLPYWGILLGLEFQ